MKLYKTGWILIVLEILLLLIWLYDVWNPHSHTDAAGKGLAQLYILVFAVYIIAGIVLQLINNKYCSLAVIIMAAIPLLIVIAGLARQYM